MIRRNLVVDGELSGTGIRDGIAGGYVDRDEPGLSADLTKRIVKWLLGYENAHYHQFVDEAENERLDREGIEIAKQVREELPDTKVEYYSHAKMRRIPIA